MHKLLLGIKSIFPYLGYLKNTVTSKKYELFAFNYAVKYFHVPCVM